MADGPLVDPRHPTNTNNTNVADGSGVSDKTEVIVEAPVNGPAVDGAANTVAPEKPADPPPRYSETDVLLERPVLHVQFDNGRPKEQDSTSIGAKSPVDATTPISATSVADGDEDGGESSSSSSSSSSEENSSLGLSEARPPDGGWGWVVVGASFLVNLIADGITFSFGVIYVEFLSYFGEGKSKTAWIGSLFMAIPLLSGPVASFLTDRYGCRRVSIVGSVLASGGFVLSSMANSVELLFFTFGGLAGFGLSLCYVAAVVIVAYYFDKRRSLATGLSVCGSGIGTFIFAPLTQFLLGEYGWRGTTLILAGLFLNIAVCGALMRDLPWTAAKRRHHTKQRRCERRRKAAAAAAGSSVDTFSAISASGHHAANGEAGSTPSTSARAASAGIAPVDDMRQFSSLVNLPTFVSESERVPVEVLELLSTHRSMYGVLAQNYPGLLTPSRSFSDSGRLHERDGESSGQHPISPCSDTDDAAAFLRWLRAREHGQLPGAVTSTVKVASDAALPPTGMTRVRARPRPRPPVAGRTPAYLRDLRVHRLSLTYRGAMLNINRYRLRASSCPDIYRNSMTTIAKEKAQWYSGLSEFWELLLDMLDLSHFSEPRFLLFAMSNFLLYTWYDVPYVYLTDNAIEMGFSETDGSVLISIVGIVNMVGEIILGWAGDKPWINAGLVYALCMALCGAVTAMVPLLDTYQGLCVVSGAFGFFIAANYSLTSIILVEVITIEKFTNAYGLLLLVQGVANLIGPPLAGWLYDITGTYHLSFYLAGLFISLSGALLVVLPATNRYRYFQSLQRQASGISADSSSTAAECSPKEPRFHTILASCITGSMHKRVQEVKINHV